MLKKAAGCILGCLLFSYAQKSDVRGVVTDSASGEKIPYATVTIHSLSRGAVTNANGFFLIPTVAPGMYDITASSLGYEPLKKAVVVKSNEPVTVNFQLASQPVLVTEVLISSSRKKELSEINSSVHVIEQQELHKVPVAAQGDLLRSIAILPGIVSSSDVSAKFYVRGGAGDQNLILFDGMKIYNPYHAFGIFGIFDPDIVKTTEVYTGAFPAGYGSRLSSVVNITSRDGNKNTFAGNASVNFISAKVQLEGPVFANSSWIVNARKSLFNESFKKFVHAASPISFYDVFAKVNFGGSEYGRQSVQIFTSSDNILADSEFEPDHRWRSTSYAFTFSDLVDNRIYFDAVGYVSNLNVVRDAKQSTLTRSAESSIGDGGIRGELTIYPESNDLYFIGFEVNVPQYSYTFTTPSDITRVIDGVAVEAWAWFRYQLNIDRLKADIGIHADINSLFSQTEVENALQPRINISYLFENDWRAKVSYGKFSQKLITLTNEDDIISLFEAWIFIPENLSEETSHHYIAGLEGNLYAELSLSVQTYLKTYPSLLLFNRDKKYPYESDYINGSGKAYGIEVLSRYGWTVVDFYLAYTLGWTSVTAHNFTYSPRYDQRHTINLLNVFHFSEHIDISMRMEIGSGYPFSQTTGYYSRLKLGDLGRNNEVNGSGSTYTIIGAKNSARLPLYHRMDVSGTYTLSAADLRTSVGINIVNVYDNHNILYYDRKTGQRIDMLPFFPSAFVKLEF